MMKPRSSAIANLVDPGIEDGGDEVRSTHHEGEYSELVAGGPDGENHRWENSPDQGDEADRETVASAVGDVTEEDAEGDFDDVGGTGEDVAHGDGVADMLELQWLQQRSLI
jgi:hypothetical protein